MPFHREYPVRTYPSLVKDLESRKQRLGQCNLSFSVNANVLDDYWSEMRKMLMRKTLDELLAIAAQEGVNMDLIVRKDSKGHVVKAIMTLRKKSKTLPVNVDK